MNAISLSPIPLIASLIAFFAFVFKQYIDEREESE